MLHKLHEKQILYAGKKVRLEVHKLEDIESGKTILREVAIHPGAVVILPFLSPEKIILIRNQRYAIGQTLIELPAGTLEKNEDPMNCAGRELQEETGYLAHRIKPLASFFSSPGVLSEKLHAFVAYDLEPTKRALEDDEEIELLPVTFDEAIDMIRLGQIIDGKTIATLLHYDKFTRSASAAHSTLQPQPAHSNSLQPQSVQPNPIQSNSSPGAPGGKNSPDAEIDEPLIGFKEDGRGR